MAHGTPNTLAKSARFHVRATDRQASLIRAGAQRKGLKLTDYIIDSLCSQAEMDLADQNHFVLPKGSGVLSCENWIARRGYLPA